ncbi:1-deoxy-D-xylulose-5-phosphate reductoisomerase [Thermanaerovibrio velox]|uniref:1-deoxy-D-xylulose-5-phosphate reductoisomerase n=1 Tax=Thermanaerovibrio velox TaxID=108007 RepID=UPI003CCB048E
MLLTPVRVGIVGATGSVGKAFCDVCALYPDRFKVVAMASGRNVSGLVSLAKKFGCEAICSFSGDPSVVSFEGRVYGGSLGLMEMIQRENVQHWAFLASGTQCVPHFDLAVSMGIDVSIANKESIVVAGPWILGKARPGQVRPVDSEHSAIWQCIMGEPSEVERVILTASGGPFRDVPLDRLKHVTPSEALAHPVWSMGAKITVDSATMANKGIECIEAMRLFDIPMDRVDALIHPRSQVHGMVMFKDGTYKMVLSRADMRLPAAMALSYPERLPLADHLAPVAISDWDLCFREVEKDRFQAFFLAKEAGKKDGPYPALYVGADEVAVESFLTGRIAFDQIPRVLEDVMSSYSGPAPGSVDEALALVEHGREMALKVCESLGRL